MIQCPAFLQISRGRTQQLTCSKWKSLASFLQMNRPGPLIDPPSLPDPSAASKRLRPWLVAVAFFMESLDTTILNTAVPTISSALGVAPLSTKAVLASYTLSLAVFIPISGWKPPA
jgi:hypothetical protein